MSIGLTPKLTEIAYRVSTSVNHFGDRTYNTEQSVPCLYRNISRLQQGQNREEVQFDGLLWFDADQLNLVNKGDIYYLPNEATYVKIDELLPAKRLIGSSHPVMFIKCGVMKEKQVS